MFSPRRSLDRTLSIRSRLLVGIIKGHCIIVPTEVISEIITSVGIVWTKKKENVNIKAY